MSAVQKILETRVQKMELIHGDRRGDRRYDIELELRYKVMARSRSTLHGAGKTFNMSSGGILFETDQLLPAGSVVELSILWPVLLENACPMTLQVAGRIVRCDQKGAAIRTTRYEFHTRGASSMPQPATEPKQRTYLA